ncbi:hypothetical protein BJV78DRAFT_1198378 [Lactifluus subvellereus]|nr:hypothetical protein BJV78DRAFT_1198378 [Lactifluus subvellereus]
MNKSRSWSRLSSTCVRSSLCILLGPYFVVIKLILLYFFWVLARPVALLCVRDGLSHCGSAKIPCQYVSPDSLISRKTQDQIIQVAARIHCNIVNRGILIVQTHDEWGYHNTFSYCLPKICAYSCRNSHCPRPICAGNCTHSC